MRITEIINESEAVDEVSLGGLAGNFARGMGSAAGFVPGLKAAYQQGKAGTINKIAGSPTTSPAPSTPTSARPDPRVASLTSKIQNLENQLKTIKAQLAKVPSPGAHAFGSMAQSLAK